MEAEVAIWAVAVGSAFDVMGWTKGSGAIRGPFFFNCRQSGEGTTYRNQYCLIYVFRDGKIAEQIEYMDHAYCEAVLGKWDEV